MFKRLVIRVLLGLLIAAAPLASTAGTVADRSPFTQGLWWDSSRSGNGFDIFNVGNDVSVLWYTYDTAGRPIWYSAQGPLAGSTTATLPLMEHRWVNGTHAATPTIAGSVRLTVKNAELIVADWTLATRAGSWIIRPFSVAGVINEIDHTGTYCDPHNSGWGMSFMEQGDVTGTILFTYDAAGLPTWLAGFGRDRGSVEMFAFTGACPGCTGMSAGSRSVGRLAYDFTQEWQLGLHSTLSVPMPMGISIEGAQVFQLGRMASLRGADRQLANFPDDASLKAYIVAGYGNIYTASPVGFSAAPPSSATPSTFSTTNLQEAGVDEADLVKTDGQYIYTFASENGVRKPVIRIAQAATDGSALSVRGSYALASGPLTATANAGLYLNGSTLASVTGTTPIFYVGLPGWAWFSPGSFSGGKTFVEIMSLTAPDVPSTRWRAEIDGTFLSSRRIGDRLYVTSRFVPDLGLAPSSLPVSSLLPKVRINGGDANPLLDASMIYSPPQGERAVVADMLVITAIDLALPRIAQNLAIIGTAETIYASTQNLYVATTRSAYRSLAGSVLSIEPFVSTDLHQIRLAATGMTIVGSGSAEGFLSGDIDKAAFRLGEYNGQLRAVTSSSSMWNGTKNRVTVLEPSTVSPGLLKTVSVLPNAARPEAVGKPGELLYATRFVGDRLYAVTFKSIDPLYVIDLSNGADPKIAGALDLSGFSDYLHPLSNGLLLGFGKDACPVNVSGDGQFAWYQGLQLALFDVSNPNQPRQLQRLLMGKRGSNSALLTSHHAFSALAQPDGSMTIAMPARIHDGAPLSTECSSVSYPWKESGLVKFDLRGTGADARLTQMPSLVTNSSQTTVEPYPDPAADGGRSIVFRSGIVYVGGGKFWRQDAGGVTAGPF